MSDPAPIHLPARGGRSYDCGRLTAHFKADGAETGDRYAVSEWVMQPGFTGVGAHSHDANDELFFGTEGTFEILVGEDWRPMKPGDFIRVPAGVTHDFRNLGDAPAALQNVFLPGGFEPMMPQIVQWFADNPEGP
ncbi:cupin domain-containing protein [Pseudooceanicola onchidii]|uniref:cupin domain-containing protein n=1 Tax=Pseudooceanicola onchidii TaxID=2562279 RepID=UPI0010A9FE23|nr:cupin domain-containing protein [Pseudooceanicola onchidii]